MKTIAIMTASIGAGHNQVANAMKESLQESDPEVKVQVFDLLEERRVYQWVNTIYLETIQKAPELFSKAYAWTQVHQTHPRVSSMIHHQCYRSLQRIQQQNRPDYFLFTNPFPVAAYRSKGLAPAYAILTDFGFHPLWCNPEINGYFVSQQEQVQALKNRGVIEEHIHLCGIPLRKGFRLDGCKRGENRFEPGGLRILLMGGGLGIGGVAGFVHMTGRIPDSIKVTAVTGHNQLLREDLLTRTRHLPNWEVVGFSYEVARLMKQSGLLITKAGAVTLSEAAACNLPTIILDSLPGQEEENATKAVDQGWALSAKTVEEAFSLAQGLSNNPARLRQMSLNAGHWAMPDAASSVSHQLQKLHPAQCGQLSC